MLSPRTAAMLRPYVACTMQRLVDAERHHLAEELRMARSRSKEYLLPIPGDAHDQACVGCAVEQAISSFT